MLGVLALGSPLLILLACLVVAERRDGKSRWVIVGGKCRSRRVMERNNKYG